MPQNILSLFFSFRRLLVIFLSLHLLAFSGLVQSAPIFLQAPLNGGDGVDAFTPDEYAAGFSLTSNETITGIQWWGSFFDAATASAAVNKFDIRFYDDNAGLPGTPLLDSFNVTAIRTITGLQDIVNEPVFRFDAALSGPLSLLANETYYVSIMNVTLNERFFWLPSNSSGSYFNQNTFNGTPWVEITGNNNLAFKLVPEPTIPALFSIALLFITLHRRYIKT